MLDTDASTALIDQLWEKALHRATTPPGDDEYFDATGVVSSRYEEQRAFVRHHLRNRAVLKIDGACYGIYTRDISREGIGLLSPIQLFPLDKARLLLPPGKAVDAVVRYCRRLGDDCYLVGCRFGG